MDIAYDCSNGISPCTFPKDISVNANYLKKNYDTYKDQRNIVDLFYHMLWAFEALVFCFTNMHTEEQGAPSNGENGFTHIMQGGENKTGHCTGFK